MSLVDTPADGESVTAMTPSHASPKPARTPGLGAAWAILIGMGATSITYNVVHAVHGGALNIFLALVYGIAPVYAAALLSHVVAEHGGGKVMQAITFVLMLGAMALSIGATAAVVKPAAGAWMQWLFGIVIDGAALVSLRVILNGRSQKARAATEAEQARTEVAAAITRAHQAEAELATVTAELGARVATMSAELATANGALEAFRTAAHPVRSKRSKSAAAGTRRSADSADLTTELRAVQMLDAHPELRAKGQGAELARRLGVSPQHGRRLHAQLRDHERPSEPAHERSADTAHERTGER